LDAMTKWAPDLLSPNLWPFLKQNPGIKASPPPLKIESNWVGSQVISFDALVASNSRMLIGKGHNLAPPTSCWKQRVAPTASNSPGKSFLDINVKCHRGR
jgi:hypothetical protein